jgi:TonB family protein
VTVTSAVRSVSQTAATNARGEFDFADLPGGGYELQVSLPGFRTVRTPIQVRPGETATVATRLDLGSLAEVVTVSSGGVARSAAVAVGQPPVNPQTADEFFAAAKALYEQARYDEASAMNAQGLALVRATLPEPAAVAAPEPAAASEGAPIRVGGAIKAPRKVRHVSPIYPTEAVASGAEGLVLLEAVIAKDGSVKDVIVARGAPMFDAAALNAVRLWMFTPTLLNGMPVEVAMTVTVRFER